MNSTAFVSATPVIARSSNFTGASSVTKHTSAPIAVVAPKRAANVVMKADENKSIPQGFTLFSEQINGRAAMFGFVVAVATEVITGQGIVGQVESVVKVVENVLPF